MEFITATLDKKLYMNKEKLWGAFKYFDVDNTGFITLKNLREATARGGKKIGDEVLKSWIKENDIKNDNKISFEEFQKMMSKEDFDEVNN